MPKKTRSRSHKPSSGAKKSTPDTCFVIMPFGGYSDAYFDSIYVPAIDAVGLEAHRAGDLYGPQAIVSDIWSYTRKSKVVLADLTGKNPNVFYELGLAHASAKPVVMVAPSMEDVPFDLRALRIIIYDKNVPEWGKVLRESIGKALTEVLASPLESVLPAFLNVRMAANPTVTPEKKELLELKRDMDLLKTELRSGQSSAPRPQLDATEARALINRYIARGYPDELIVDRLSEMGVPRMWLRQRLIELRRPPSAAAPSSGPQETKPTESHPVQDETIKKS
jgi:hypothetical protein